MRLPPNMLGYAHSAHLLAPASAALPPRNEKTFRFMHIFDGLPLIETGLHNINAALLL